MGPLAKNLPLLVIHVWSGLLLAVWEGTLLTWLYAPMSATMEHPVCQVVGGVTYSPARCRGPTMFQPFEGPLPLLGMGLPWPRLTEGAPGLDREIKRNSRRPAWKRCVIWIWRLRVGEQLTWFRRFLWVRRSAKEFM